MVNQCIAFESTELYQLKQDEGLINRTPGKEGKHVVILRLLSVVQYQLNICKSRVIFMEKILPHFKYIYIFIHIKSVCFHLFWSSSKKK